MAGRLSFALEIEKGDGMIGTRLFAFAIAMMLSTHTFADEANPSKIFEKVITTYKSMQTYKAQGRITSNIETGMKMNTQTEFSMVLKKPNLYRITWTQKNMPMPGMAQSGAVWSDGSKPYLYMGIMNTYSKMDNDEIALSSATGISGGAAFTIPSLFLSVFKNQPPSFSRLIDPKLERIEKVEDEECYVISASSSISKKEVFWISKKRNLILKYSRSLEPPEGCAEMPEIDDKQLEEAIKAMGQEVNEETKRKMKEMMESAKATIKTSNLKGSSLEVHSKILMPELKKKDFLFKVPSGTILKKSLFGSFFGNEK